MKIKNKKILEALSGENFLDSVIENIPHMIFVKDAKELRFVRFNKAGEELLGYSKKFLMGKNDYDFFPRAEADFFTKKDREVLRKGKLFDISNEPIHTHKRGIRFLHTKKIPILNAKGHPVYLLGISEDITDRLRLEKEIAEISDREQKRIGQDLHDGLGQLLTGISYMSKALAQKLEEKNSPERTDAVRIADLVSQTIGMTRNLAKLLNPIDLESGGFEDALKILTSNTEKLFKIHCRYKIHTPLKFTDIRSATQIYRIIQEAVDNAVRHGHPQKIAINLHKNGEILEVLIRDNGKGLPKILGKREGMGINNMIYRASMMGGDLKIYSRPEGGTDVVCTIPWTEGGE